MPNYTLIFEESSIEEESRMLKGLGPCNFEAADDQTAIEKVAVGYFKYKGELTKEVFYNHDGKAIIRNEGGNEIQIFPPVPEKITVTVQSPHQDVKT